MADREDLIYQASQYGSVRQGPQPIGSDPQADAMKDMSKIMPDLVKAMQSMSMDMGKNIEQFGKLVEGIGDAVKGIEGFSSAFNSASEKMTSNLTSATAKWSDTMKNVGSELQKSLVNPFVQGGKDVLNSLGPIGSAIQGISGLIEKIPFVGSIAKIAGVYAALQIGASVLEKDLGARVYRIGAVLQGYEGMGYNTAKGMGSAILKVSENWSLGLSGAEAYLTKIAGVGKLAIWDSKEAITTFADSIMNMSFAAGVSENITLGYFKKLLHATDMQKESANEVYDALVKVFMQANESGVGTQAYVDVIMRGTEHMRLFGAEQRTVVESARLLGVIQKTMGGQLPGKEAGAFQMYESVMGVTGGIMQNPAEMLWTFGKGGQNPFAELVGVYEELGKGGKGIDPWEIFETWYKKMATEMGGVGELARDKRGYEEMMGLLTQKMPRGTSPLALDALITKMNQIVASMSSKDGPPLASETMEKFKQNYRDLAHVMTDPMKRIQHVLETMMIEVLPRLAQLTTSLLQAILLAIPTYFTKLMAFFEGLNPLTAGGPYAKAAAQLELKFIKTAEDVGVQGVAVWEGISKSVTNVKSILFTPEELKAKGGVLGDYGTMAESFKSWQTIPWAYGVAGEAITGPPGERTALGHAFRGLGAVIPGTQANREMGKDIWGLPMNAISTIEKTFDVNGSIQWVLNLSAADILQALKIGAQRSP